MKHDIFDSNSHNIVLLVHTSISYRKAYSTPSLCTYIPFSCCQSYLSDENNEEESATDNKEKSLSDGEE